MIFSTLGRLGNRVLHSFIVTAIIIFIIILLTVIFIRVFLNENIQGQRSLDSIDETATQIYEAVNDQIMGQRGYSITNDESFLDTYYTGVEDFNEKSVELKKAVEDFPVLKNQTEEFLEAGQYILDSFIHPYIEMQKNGQAINRETLQKSEKAVDEFRSIYADYYTLIDDERTTVRNTMQFKINFTLISIVIAILIVLIVNVVINIKILKKVIQPLIQLSSSVKAYTEHDFSKNVPVYKKQDELNELIQNIDIMRNELAENIQSLQYMANIDALTGLYNRRYFNQHLEEQWKWAVEHAEPISLILLDIDHYKKYNDTYGHVKGDECLQAIAECLKQHNEHPNKFVSRYGGEEFCLLLLSHSEEEVAKLSEQIRKDIQNLQLPHETSPTNPYVTVSVGTAFLLPKEGSNPNELILMADEALYHSKNNGRNQVTIFKQE